jgi:hypothetical protein
VGSIETERVPAPVARGEPEIGVRAPVEGLIAKANKLLVVAPFLSLTSYRNLPLGSDVSDVGFAPAGKGEPGTRVRVPVFGSTEKPEMLPVCTLPKRLFAT